jgi:two-component system OmpR family response regulator
MTHAGLRSSTVRVLVTEDDARMASLLGQALTEADHDVRVVASGERAIDALREDAYDLVLLDVMLPRLDGFATCRRMRERGATMPILMLTARDDVEDRVRGLDAGADDYLCKPFSLDELLARVRAVERRGGAGYGSRLTVGPLVLDSAALALWRDGERIDLTPRECAVLEVLMRESGRVVRRQRIFAHAWPDGADHRSNVLEVLIRRIREKIDRPFGTDSIQTVRGLGYRLDAA